MAMMRYTRRDSYEGVHKDRGLDAGDSGMGTRIYVFARVSAGFPPGRRSWDSHLSLHTGLRYRARSAGQCCGSRARWEAERASLAALVFVVFTGGVASAESHTERTWSRSSHMRESPHSYHIPLEACAQCSIIITPECRSPPSLFQRPPLIAIIIITMTEYRGEGDCHLSVLLYLHLYCHFKLKRVPSSRRERSAA